MNAPLRADFHGGGTSREIRAMSMESSLLRRANSARAAVGLRVVAGCPIHSPGAPV